MSQLTPGGTGVSGWPPGKALEQKKAGFEPTFENSKAKAESELRAADAVHDPGDHLPRVERLLEVGRDELERRFGRR